MEFPFHFWMGEGTRQEKGLAQGHLANKGKVHTRTSLFTLRMALSEVRFAILKPVGALGAHESKKPSPFQPLHQTDTAPGGRQPPPDEDTAPLPPGPPGGPWPHHPHPWFRTFLQGSRLLQATVSAGQ